MDRSDLLQFVDRGTSILGTATRSPPDSAVEQMTWVLVFVTGAVFTVVLTVAVLVLATWMIEKGNSNSDSLAGIPQSRDTRTPAARVIRERPPRGADRIGHRRQRRPERMARDSEGPWTSSQRLTLR